MRMGEASDGYIEYAKEKKLSRQDSCVQQM